MIQWLTDTLIATSALMALVLIVREPARRAFGPGVAYGLWLLPAARMVMPSLTRTVERIVPVTAPGAVEPASALAQLPIAEATPGMIDQLGGWPTLVIGFWLAVAAVMLARGVAVYIAQRRAILGDSVQLARIGKIRLVRSERVSGPMAFGIIDRVVIVPLDFDQRFSECQRRLALDHELAHHRSGDLVANIVAFVLLCLHWFNPLAWAAHAAFRFDQEAACDARVLSRANDRDRISYGLAIANAASGRALLFSGALDRPSTLSRRLTLMTRTTRPMTRRIGFALVGGAVFIALPGTATWAVNYIDVPGAAPLAPAALAQPTKRGQMIASATAPRAAPAAGLLPAAAPAPVAAPASTAAPEPAMRTDSHGSLVLPGGVTLDKGSTAFFDDDRVYIDGKVMRIEQATPAERSRLRVAIAKSLRSIERERADLPRRLADARRELERIRNGDFKREILSDREDLRRDLAEIAAEASEMRANGENPEKRKAEILRDLREAEAIDIDKEIREAMQEADPEKIVAEFRRDEEQMKRLQARLDQLDRR